MLGFGFLYRYLKVGMFKVDYGIDGYSLFMLDFFIDILVKYKVIFIFVMFEVF